MCVFRSLFYFTCCFKVIPCLPCIIFFFVSCLPGVFASVFFFFDYFLLVPCWTWVCANNVDTGCACSGIASQNLTLGHSVLRGTSGALCGGTYHVVGHFQFATEVPMLHSSALDAAGQRLFLDLSVDKTTVAVGVIDLKTAKVIKTITEGTPQVDALVGIHYNAADKSLYAVQCIACIVTIGIIMVPEFNRPLNYGPC